MTAWICLLLLAVVGAASTVARIGGTPAPHLVPFALALSAACVLTGFNLTLRWMRWHFLLRTFGVRLRARTSTLLFASLLPMVLTPWAAGELALAVFLRSSTRRPLRTAMFVWLIARGVDALSLALLFYLGRSHLLLPVLAGLLLSSVVLAAIDHKRGPWDIWIRLYHFTALSLLAWTLAGFALFSVLQVLGAATTSMQALATFAEGTLKGALTGAPGGIAVSGAAMIRALTAVDVPTAVAVWSVAALRGGTVGFAVALGLATAWKFRGALRDLALGRRPASQGHFEELAAEYADEIPAHVRDRLIETKSAVLLRILERNRVPLGARGLDLGCGHGWYLAHMARHGYVMSGCDLTAGQIERARAYVQAAGVQAELQVASAEHLPYADDSFDFAYAINVIHHITDPDALHRSLHELCRVLKPGAPLMIFEMNTLNPLFRFYMSYLFPFIRNIDDGTEVWLTPGRLPEVSGATWSREIDFITFIPDFVPRRLLAPLSALEARLERSMFRRFSAHFAITLLKNHRAT